MAISIAERYVSIALSLVSFVAIARLLTPADIGLFSIASALVGLAQVVRDFGVGSYLVQETELTPQRVNTAFTLTTVIGFLLFCTSFVAAPLIAAFYVDARLTEILRVLSINFLLIPIGSTSLALLRREMRFGGIFIVNLGANIASFALTMALAFTGHAHMSLVWSSVAGTALTAGIAWYLRPNDAPLQFGLRDWRRVVSYGGQLTAAGVITELAMNVNDLVIGRVMGPASVAIASRAQGVMNLMHRDLLGAVSGVMFAAFSRAHRDGDDMLASYRNGVAMVTCVAWPFYGFVALFPLGILRLLFGSQWDEAAKLVPIFCLAGAFSALWNLTLPLISALGRADLIAKSSVLISTTRVVVLTTIAIYFKDLALFASAFAAIYFLHIPVLYHYMRIALGTNKRISLHIEKSIKVTLVTLAVPAAVAVSENLQLIPPLREALLLLLVSATAIIWLFCVHHIRHPIARDSMFLYAVNMMRRSMKKIRFKSRRKPI